VRAVDVVFVLTGLVFIARGLMELGKPAFSNATTPFDYAAVLGTTLAMYGLALGLSLLRAEGALRGPARSIVWLPIVAVAVSGTANLLEDAFGVSEVGILFGVGNLLFLIGVVATGVAALIDRRNDRMLAALILGVGAAFMLPVTLGWVVLGALCIAIAAGGHVRRAGARAPQH
jgi:asparagine N-glycosylation enzyme membrane subunit Stt3